MTLTFGNAKHPAFVDRLVPDSQNQAWDDLGPLSQEGVVQHTMVGGLWGTDKWFRNDPTTGRRANGLTHYGIGGATDGADDGVIVRWNDPYGKAHGTKGTAAYVSPNRAGWANGGSDGLEGDGPAFYAKYGAAGINTRLVSIERSDGGDVTTPPSEKYIESFCRLAAFYADQDEIPWDQYPIRPKTGLTFYYLHKEFATKDCPHPAIYNHVDDIFIPGVQEILKAAQTQAGYPAPFPFPAFDGLDHGEFKALQRAVIVKRGGGAICRTRAATSMPESRAPIPKGAKVPVIAIIKANDGTRWYLHRDGHRMQMTHFEETFSTNLWTA